MAPSISRRSAKTTARYRGASSLRLHYYEGLTHKRSRIGISHCRGSTFRVHAVVFSPDGMTLASAGRGEAKLWDAATGRLLLDLIPPKEYRNRMTGVAFSPDSLNLAVGSLTNFSTGGLDVWELRNGRGDRTLRGPVSQLSLAVSQDGKRIAALSRDWQVAIWDADAGRLLQLLDAPRGLLAAPPALARIDNAGEFGPIPASDDGVTPYRVGEERPLANLRSWPPSRPCLRSQLYGRFVYWGRRDGTVWVADFNRCLEKLAPFGNR
jgi:WD40 repeat protein